MILEVNLDLLEVNSRATPIPLFPPMDVYVCIFLYMGVCVSICMYVCADV